MFRGCGSPKLLRPGGEHHWHEADDHLVQTPTVTPLQWSFGALIVTSLPVSFAERSAALASCAFCCTAAPPVLPTVDGLAIPRPVPLLATTAMDWPRGLECTPIACLAAGTPRLVPHATASKRTPGRHCRYACPYAQPGSEGNCGLAHKLRNLLPLRHASQVPRAPHHACTTHWRRCCIAGPRFSQMPARLPTSSSGEARQSGPPK